MNIRDDLKTFYVGDRQGTAIYVGSTKVWPCPPIPFIDDTFRKAVARQYLGSVNSIITECNNPDVISWYINPTSSNPKTSIFRADSSLQYQLTTSIDAQKYITENTDTDLYYLFAGCRSLTYILPDIFIGKKRMYGALSGIGATEIDPLDLSNAVDCTGLFRYSEQLKTAPQITFSSTEKVTVYQMFRYCYRLQSVPQYDASNWSNFSDLFRTDDERDQESKDFTLLTDIGGFTNIGMGVTMTTYTLHLGGLPALTVQSINNIIEGLYSDASKNPTIVFNKVIFDSLTEDQKAQIVSKGWTISYSN